MSLPGHFSDNSELSPQPVNRWFRKQPAPASNRLQWHCGPFPAGIVMRNLPRALVAHVAYKEEWPEIRLRSALGNGW